MFYAPGFASILFTYLFQSCLGHRVIHYPKLDLLFIQSSKHKLQIEILRTTKPHKTPVLFLHFQIWNDASIEEEGKDISCVSLLTTNLDLITCSKTALQMLTRAKALKSSGDHNSNSCAESFAFFHRVCGEHDGARCGDLSDDVPHVT